MSLGGESDRIAALAGQFAGAAGAELPRDLLERIAGIREIEAAVERFALLRVEADGRRLMT